MTDAEMYATIRSDALTRLSELDNVSVELRADQTYTTGGQTFGWNEYRAALQAKVEWTYKMEQAAIDAQVKTQGPFTFLTPGV